MPTDAKNLGIETDVPVYTSFLKNPNLYQYLNDPESVQDEFFAMLKEK